jgi:hypothetical protein
MPARVGMRGMAGRLTKVRRVDRVPPVEPAAQGEGGQWRNGIRPGNGYTSGPVLALKEVEPGRCTMPTPPGT